MSNFNMSNREQLLGQIEQQALHIKTLKSELKGCWNLIAKKDAEIEELKK